VPGPHGILIVNKPSGPTSHDCVARVRRVLRVRRVGHAGTLDPLATGVLVMGIGHGTRILEYLQDLPKTYRARVRFGMETDTQDITGEVTALAETGNLTEEAFATALQRFQGPQVQLPPMYSALKSGGRRLYELARQGQSVEREPRPITVYSIEPLAFHPGTRAEAEFRVCCSTGTYVRTLCHDLGRLLGVGGAMAALEREAVGGLTLEDAVPLREVAPGVPLMPLGTALGHLPCVLLPAGDAARLAQGQFVPAPPDTPDGPVRVLAEDGELLAVAQARGHGAARLLAPEKVFPPDAD
jgi:tRNA pseudouridine55 synthase